ncbi:MAG TPA: hypothetical protein VF385_00865 [Patescibacteria group bacterium]
MLVEKKHYENNQKRFNILPIAYLVRGISGLFNRKPIGPSVPNELTEMSPLQQRLQLLENVRNRFLNNFIPFADEQSRSTYERCVKDLNEEIQQLNEQVDR